MKYSLTKFGYRLIVTLIVLALGGYGRLMAQDQNFPAYCTTVVDLNMRTSPTPKSHIATVAKEGTELKVLSLAGNDAWAKVLYGSDTLYCSYKHLNYDRPCNADAVAKPKKKIVSKDGSLINKALYWGWFVIKIFIFLFLLKWLLIVASRIISFFAYKLYWVCCIPFYFLNWLQRYASKPWRWIFKNNRGNDFRNRKLRQQLEYVKIPLYVALMPLRFINAVYYNLFVHCSFEFMNYALEVLSPENPKEGADDTMEWLMWLPWRIVKYPVWHGLLTVTECVVWTVIDTFIPALTLFHGTDIKASTSITQSRGRVGANSWRIGGWNVGGGNYAGNGIYFAPDRSTALHYSAGSLIVCRVTLGRVLDLGLAPKRIFDQCGHPDALGATKWGLKHDYVTGEWWRGDCGWWEYCMYDWQNRYNQSWRIRPLYVLSIDDKLIQRIPGGTHHWLFRKMVINDLAIWIKHLRKKYRK